MLLTKMLLTEILLDVTDEEIYYIAKDAHRKATKGILWMFLVLFSGVLILVTISDSFCGPCWIIIRDLNILLLHVLTLGKVRFVDSILKLYECF